MLSFHNRKPWSSNILVGQNPRSWQRALVNKPMNVCRRDRKSKPRKQNRTDSFSRLDNQLRWILYRAGIPDTHFSFPFIIDWDCISCDLRGSMVQEFLHGDITAVVVSLIKKKQETKWWTGREKNSVYCHWHLVQKGSRVSMRGYVFTRPVISESPPHTQKRASPSLPLCTYKHFTHGWLSQKVPPIDWIRVEALFPATLWACPAVPARAAHVWKHFWAFLPGTWATPKSLATSQKL